MTGFAAGWLQLREPYDLAARNRPLLHRLQNWRRRRPDSLLQIVDLGAGTGANFRALAPLLGGRQHWYLLDHAPELLAQASAYRDSFRSGSWRVTVQCSDLASELISAMADADLICANALLDLVSARWLERLTTQRYPAWYCSLNYTGHAEWQPADEFDTSALALFNRHQRRDKGFGPALGPAATTAMAKRLREYGYTVYFGLSPWRLQATDRAIQSELLQGWHQAAAEIAPGNRLDNWTQRRRERIEAGGSRLTIGHRDLFAERRKNPAAGARFR